MIKRLLFTFFVFWLWNSAASAQTILNCYNSNSGFSTTQPCPGNKNTTNNSAVITTGGTYQTILTASTARASLTVENNNATDLCYLYIGSGSATNAKSILLIAGGSYTRYFPYVPADAIQATCANNSDTLYVDTQ